MKKKFTSSFFLILIPFLGFTQGNALNFDGGNDGINISASLLSSANPGQPYTLEAWIKAPPQSGNCIICQHDFPGENRFQFMIDNNKLRWEKGNSSTPVGISSSTIIGDDQWHHIAATRDASGNVILYVDGIQDGTGIDNLPFYGSTTNIGERILTNGGHFLGNIDEVRIWGIVRTQTEIQSTMFQELNGDEPNLFAYYDFNQGVAGGANPGIGTLIDRTASMNNGTLENFTLSGPLSNWIGSSFPLPIELIEFKGWNDKIGNHLTWTTLSEIDNLGFEIQRSSNGVNWFPIGFVDGNRTTMQKSSYDFIDQNPRSGNNLYRLKQINLDGSYEYSKVISVTVDKENEIDVFPNPSYGEIHILGTEKADVFIYDAMGNLVKEVFFFNQKIDVTDLPLGLYFVLINADKGITHKRLIIE